MAEKQIPKKRLKVKVCAVSGCEKRARSLGFCPRHYQQIKRHGHVSGNPSHTQKDSNEFFIEDNVCYIQLYNKLGWPTEKAIIDASDYNIVKNSKWRLTSLGYVVTGKRGASFRLHWIISGTRGSRNVMCDHIDGNKLNNRRSNLRLCTPQQNSRNRRPTKKAMSQYKGVTLCKNGKWQATICINGKANWLGYFNDEISAASAYNIMAKDKFGEYAWLNKITT